MSQDQPFSRLKLHANGIRLVDRPGTYPAPQDYIALPEAKAASAPTDSQEK